ncbi:MAG: glucosyl transferase, partial [Ignavibacterium sp.]
MKSKTYMPLLTLIIQLLLFATSCKQTTEPKLEAELKLELEDASCTEAWIKLTTTNLQLPATINLLQDGNLSETINLLGADTVLYVDSLLPNQTYKFQASIQLYLPKAGIQPFNHSGLPAEGRHSSNELTVTTMDTTSHNFTWQSWEFGQHSSSTLYDVAII